LEEFGKGKFAKKCKPSDRSEERPSNRFSSFFYLYNRLQSFIKKRSNKLTVLVNLLLPMIILLSS